MHGASSVVQENVRQYVTGRSEPLRFDSFLQAEFVLLSQVSAVSVWMRSTGFERLFRRLWNSNERNALLACAEESAERVLKFTAAEKISCYC